MREKFGRAGARTGGNPIRRRVKGGYFDYTHIVRFG